MTPDRTYLLTRLLQLEKRLYEMQQQRDTWKARSKTWQYRFYNASWRARKRV